MRKNKNVLVLAAAAIVLLVLAYVLSRTSAEAAGPDAGPGAKQLKQRAQVVYPRDHKKLAAPAPTASPGDKPAAPAPALDAMQRALLGGNSGSAVFVEANAIRHAPLMEKMLRCREKESAGGLDDLKKQLGIDPMEDVDRIGFDGQVFAASGFFEKLKIPPEIGEGKPYGNGGRIYQGEDSGAPVYFGKVGDNLMMTSADESQLKAAMDRASNKDAPTPPMPAGFGEGEVYGTMGAAFLAGLFANEQDPTVKQLGSLLQSSTVRMNVDEDAALSLDLEATDDKSAGDLKNAIGGVLSGLRAKAVSEGDGELAALLEQARVSPANGSRFNLDVAVPGDTLLRGMGCNPDGTPINAMPTKLPAKQATPTPSATPSPAPTR